MGRYLNKSWKRVLLLCLSFCDVRTVNVDGREDCGKKEFNSPHFCGECFVYLPHNNLYHG